MSGLGLTFRNIVRRNRVFYTPFRTATASPFVKFNSRLFSKVSLDDNTSLVRAVTDKNSLTLHWKDGGDVRLHHVWLRHHCSCSECLDPQTKQRTVDMALIPGGIQPQEVKIDSKRLTIVWEDGHQTFYDLLWLRGQAARRTLVGSIADEAELLLWNNDIIAENPPPEFNYHDLQNNDDAVKESLNSIFRYGFIFVNETPTQEASLINVCKRIGGVVQNNLYGQVYVLENKVLTKSDIAYLSNALHGHTGHAYFCQPAGLQAMHCTHHNGTGGMSFLVDGFWAAKCLFKEHPEAYKILTTTEVPFEFNSEEHCIRVHGAILETDPFTHELKQIRYNNSRVGPFLNMDLSFDEMGEFYHAVRLFGLIVRRPENELRFKLVPGKAIVVDNRRALHGRTAITGSRSLMGCYVGMDDYMGRWRANKIK